MLGDRDRAVNKRHPFPIFKEVIKYAIERGHHKKCGITSSGAIKL